MSTNILSVAFSHMAWIHLFLFLVASVEKEAIDIDNNNAKHTFIVTFFPICQPFSVGL